jgi:transglutaminase-like putative cysteine protease
MQIHIEHDTIFRYPATDGPVVAALRVWPISSSSQTINEWSIQVDGHALQARYKDGFGNYLATRTVTAVDTVHLSVRGRVHTFGGTGVHQGEEQLPPVFFLCGTELTMAGPAIYELARRSIGQSNQQRVSDANSFEQLNRLLNAVCDRMSPVATHTGTYRTAEQALAAAAGRPQELAHVLIAAAQAVGFPARCISGYLRAGSTETAAMHAWTEIFLADRGWVGFDAVNRCAIDDRYVRVASGRDIRDAAPIRCVTTGRVAEPIEITHSHLSKTASAAGISRISGQSQQQSQQQSAS